MVSITVMILNYLIAAIVVVSIISLDSGYSQVRFNSSTNERFDNVTHVNETRIDLMKNPNFTFFNDTAGLPSYWFDSLKHCRTVFSCTIKYTDGWNDYVSFALSTTNNTNNTWSAFYAKPIDVEPNLKYQLVSHMKLNEWATQSHVKLEGFNETSRLWYQIAQCPSGINGPLDWREFNCNITIPDNTSKIRPVLNAGWSSQPNKEATTWFDSINIFGSVTP